MFRSKHKKQFFGLIVLGLCSLPLSLLSHFFVTYLGLIVLRLWIVVEFVIWVSSCSMVVIQWVFGFRRVGCDPVGFWVSLCWFRRAQWHYMGFAVLNGVTVLSIWWVFGFHHVGCDPVVIWVFWVSPCSMVLDWLCCGLWFGKVSVMDRQR